MNTLSDSLISEAASVSNSLVLKTGRDDCVAHFYPARYQLIVDCEGTQSKVELGFSGSRLLERLLQNPGEVVARDDLMRFAWSDRIVGQGSLNQQIYTLRQILGDEKDRQIIQTLPRRGYLINPHYLLAAANASGPSPEPPMATQPAPEATPEPELAPEPLQALQTAGGVPPEVAKPLAPTSWQKPWLLGGGMLLALAVLALLLPFHFHHPLASQAIKLGAVEILYIGREEGQLQPLVNSTQQLSRRLAQLAEQPLELMLVMNGDFYEVLCVQPNGKVRWLMIHHSQLEQVQDEQLRRCLP